MRRRCRYINPLTGSYEREDGNWKRDETGGTQIYLAICTKFGTVPGNRTLGCRLPNREKIGPSIKSEATKDLEDAVSQLLEDGIIDSFDVVYLEQNADNPSRIDFGYHWTAEGEDYYHDDFLAIGTST